MVTTELKIRGKQKSHPIGVLPRPANMKPKEHEDGRWEAFTKEPHVWSSHWEPHSRLPLTEWTEKTLEILCDQAPGTHVDEDVWAKLMIRKRRWAVRTTLSEEAQVQQNVKGGGDAGRAPRRRRGAAFAPISSLRDKDG